MNPQNFEAFVSVHNSFDEMESFAPGANTKFMNQE